MDTVKTKSVNREYQMQDLERDINLGYEIIYIEPDHNCDVFVVYNIYGRTCIRMPFKKLYEMINAINTVKNTNSPEFKSIMENIHSCFYPF